jgi:hypothetical protein
VQADSGSDSDSESRNKNEEIIPVNRLTPDCHSLPNYWVVPKRRHGLTSLRCAISRKSAVLLIIVKYDCNCMGQQRDTEWLETFRNLVWEPKESDNLGDVGVDSRECSGAL